MSINATLIGQMITFALFVWFTMKLVWPHIIGALEERQQKIADGLAAAERGQHELELAQHKITEQLRETKSQQAEILDAANKKASHIVDDAKVKARQEGERLIEVAKAEIEQEANHVKQAIRKQFAETAILGAEKILAREVDAKAHSELLDKLIEEI